MDAAASPGASADTEPTIYPPNILERVQHEIGDLFRHANLDHPAVAELHRLCMERRIRQLMESD